MANLGFMIVFGIRCNFGAAKGSMIHEHKDSEGVDHKAEFNWTRAELGVMESSFFYGYLVTQVPAGFLAAKFPANKYANLLSSRVVKWEISREIRQPYYQPYFLKII